MSANKLKPTRAQQGRRLGGSPSNRIGRAGMARSEEKNHGWIEIQHIINRMQKVLPKSNNGPVGLMDKASASGAGDSRFESWAGHLPLRNKYRKY